MTRKIATMGVSVLENQDVTKLENLLIKDGKIIPVHSKKIRGEFSPEMIMVFCHKHAIYQIPTIELIEFLEALIPDKQKTIEIGAGNGCIGRALGIKMVDNKMQTWPEIKERYRQMSQPTINYGEDVETLDANSAVVKYQPKTVIASWVTQKFYPGLVGGSNPHGIDEMKMFNDGVTRYVHIGNENVHGDKLILKSLYEVRRFRAKWLLSRAQNQAENVIYVIEKK